MVKSRRLLIGLLAALVVVTVTLAARDVPQKSGFCAGRYCVSARVSLQVESEIFDFYWSRVQTFRESDAEYEQRLRRVQDQARRSGRLIKPATPFGSRGLLMVTQEEFDPPFDPNASQVLAYTRQGAVTFELRKRTVNRLLGVAEARAKEILASAREPSPSAGSDATGKAGFCIAHGCLTVQPLEGWHESAEVNGAFTEDGERYHFLFHVSPVPDEYKATDMEYRRELMLTATKGVRISSNWARPHEGGGNRSEMLMVADGAGGWFPVYEWRSSRHDMGGPNPAVIYFCIWPDDRSRDSAGVKHLVDFAQNPKSHELLPLIIQPIARAVPGIAARMVEAVPEESKFPYSTVLKKRQTDELLVNYPYRLVRKGKTVFEGRTDANGFTFTQNVEYLEPWSVVTQPLK